MMKQSAVQWCGFPNQEMHIRGLERPHAILHIQARLQESPLWSKISETPKYH
jgi:hypothetical protein